MLVLTGQKLDRQLTHPLADSRYKNEQNEQTPRTKVNVQLQPRF